MNINQMRQFLADRYSPQFAKRLDRMSDDQVVAIYYRVVGSENMKIKKKSHNKRETKNKEPQLALF